jgi:hypothetical protein
MPWSFDDDDDGSWPVSWLLIRGSAREQMRVAMTN